MLDIYTTGSVKRVSPEAPVPILSIEKTEYLPGGSGNVALNLKALGAMPLCLGRVGPDLEGRRLKSLLKRAGVDVSGLFIQSQTSTPVKNRLIAQSQQLMRVDDESLIPINTDLETQALAFITTHLDEIKVIAISDYGKGFLSRRLLTVLIGEGKKRGIPVIVDPKGDDFSRYLGATMIKPNLREAIEAAKLSSAASLDEVGFELLRLTQTEQVIVTCAEKGMTCFGQENRRFNMPVKPREVNDVTGAGDTALAVIAMACAAGLDVQEGIYLANVAASIAIERIGCAHISLSDIAERLLETQVQNKIFDQRHSFIFQQALKNKKLIILGLNTKRDLPTSFMTEIRTLALGDKDRKLVVYLSGGDQKKDVLSLLSSLREVDCIVIKPDHLSKLCEQIHPTQVYALDETHFRQVSYYQSLIEESRDVMTPSV